MGRKAKYSKEVKVKECKDYDKGNTSYKRLGDETGTTDEIVRQWYLKYKEHGESAFNT